MDQHGDRPLGAGAQALGHFVACAFDGRERGRLGPPPGVIAAGRYVQGQVLHHVSLCYRHAACDIRFTRAQSVEVSPACRTARTTESEILKSLLAKRSTYGRTLFTMPAGRAAISTPARPVTVSP